jgi:hypothetical protein
MCPPICLTNLQTRKLGHGPSHGRSVDIIGRSLRPTHVPADTNHVLTPGSVRPECVTSWAPQFCCAAVETIPSTFAVGSAVGCKCPRSRQSVYVRRFLAGGAAAPRILEGSSARRHHNGRGGRRAQSARMDPSPPRDLPRPTDRSLPYEIQKSWKRRQRRLLIGCRVCLKSKNENISREQRQSIAC